MKHLNIILIGVAIPMLLTGTVFAVPGPAGIFSLQGNDASNASEGKAPGVSEEQSSGSLVQTAFANSGITHNIVLGAQRLDNGLFAYKMISHKIVDGDKKSADLTKKYEGKPTIPGPTIIITEGDEVFLTIRNQIGEGIVSVHVHGVHYNIQSDGTLEHINGILDEGAKPGKTYTYHWVAGPGTAGSWPYHDHTFGGINGAEHRGLFGALVVNPADGNLVGNVDDDSTPDSVALSSINKNFVIYMGDDAFWAQEIRADGKQKALWTNPTLVAKTGDNVTFHIIALGTDMHEFELTGHQWFNPGTTDLIGTEAIGPLENHVFTIKAQGGTHTYTDLQTSNSLMGMEGTFKVTASGGNSVASPVPDAF